MLNLLFEIFSDWCESTYTGNTVISFCKRKIEEERPGQIEETQIYCYTKFSNLLISFTKKFSKLRRPVLKVSV